MSNAMHGSLDSAIIDLMGNSKVASLCPAIGFSRTRENGLRGSNVADHMYLLFFKL